MKAVCVGYINIVQRVDTLKRRSVRNVFYAPVLTANLLSVNRIVQNGNTVEFEVIGFRIYSDNHKLLATALPC